MSLKETTDSIGHLDASGSPKDGLPKLAEQARRAYEQKRTKDCLDLTRAILLIDPDNTAAHLMRSSIQLEMHRDLENARAFLREAQSKETKETSSEPAVEPPVSEPALPKSSPSPVRHWLVYASVFIALALGVSIAGFLRFKSRPKVAASNPSKAVEAPNVENAATLIPLLLTSQEVAPYAPEFTSATDGPPLIVNPPPSLAAKPSGLPAADSPLSRAPAPPIDSPAPRPAKLPDPSVPGANGILAVSSPTAIDIYKDDAYIGSAPVSLELPPGLQTFEYRHGRLNRKVTHQINSNETTRATITFDVDVQVNSRPWAEVFVDGIERKALGQTPLSGVRVPIGSVLVFENPQFPKKKYRVTGNETGIQIVFP
jgi:hypothetical protein